MSKFEKGILGGFSGKVGTVIGTSWRGFDVMRSRPRKSGRPASAKQLNQRMVFALVVRFMTPIRSLLGDYFGQPAGNLSRADLAMSYLLTEGTTGAYPDITLDYNKIMVTKGDLAGIQDLQLTPMPNAVLRFTWQNNYGQPEASNSDLLLAVVYNPDKGRFQYSRTELRAAELLNMHLPDSWSGDVVHCWLGFTSQGSHRASTSVYLTTVVQ